MSHAVSIIRAVSDAYRVREATLEDEDVLVRHRIGMFTDMGVPLDAAALDHAFRAWLRQQMPAGTYRAWVVELVTDDEARKGPSTPLGTSREGRKGGNGCNAAGIVAGGGLTVLPWPPGPRYMGDRLAFVYNVYTEPAHRRRGLARLVMDAMHRWCRDAGISSIALNASADGRPLYESLGYHVSPNPMMFFPVARYNPAVLAAERPTD
jgi:GNAT superfamily N-acetyltransferase